MAKTPSEKKCGENEKIIRDMEAALRRMDERRTKGERDPHLLIYTAIKENGNFDAARHLKQLLGAIKYEGPERRGNAEALNRPLQKVRRIPGRVV